MFEDKATQGLTIKLQVNKRLFMFLCKKNLKLLLELLQLSFRSLLGLLFSKLYLLAVLSLSLSELSCFIDSLSDTLNLLLALLFISLDLCGFTPCRFSCFLLGLLKNHLAMLFEISGMLLSLALLLLLALKFSLLTSLLHGIVAFLAILSQDLLPLFALIGQEFLLLNGCVVIDLTHSLPLVLVVLDGACNCLSLSLFEAL